MSKEQTQIIKGVAILMMLFYHLFNNASALEDCTPIFVLDGIPLVTIVARACNPVMIFIILSGYGFHYVYRQGKLRFVRQCKRVIKLYISYWITLAFFVPVGVAVARDHYPGSWTILTANVTAYLSTYNYETWFIFPYVLITLSCFWIFRIQDYLGHLLSVFLSGSILILSSYFISSYIVPAHANDSILNHILTYFQFMFPIVIGGCLHDWSSKGSLPKLHIHPIYVILMIGILLISRMSINTNAFNSLYAAALIWLFLQIRHLSPALQRVLSFLGEYSLMIWLTHTYFAYYLFRSIIYGARYPLLIFVLLLVITLPVAMVLTKVSSLICQKILK